MEELIKNYDEYIKLLGDEINELCSIASLHGWNKKNLKKRLRDKIEEYKRMVQGDGK